MEHYEMLDMEIIEIDKRDVICTSGGGDGGRRDRHEGEMVPIGMSNSSDNGFWA